MHHAHRPGAAELRASHHAWLPESAFPAGHAQIRICVIGEQGLGDELFFLRYVPRLLAMGPRVTVRCSSRIAPLLRRVDGFPEIVGDETAVPEADVRILCGDLPLALGHTEQRPVQSAPAFPRPALRDYAQSIGVYWPAPAPSLLIPASRERTAEVRARLAALGRGPYVGMTWRAGIAPEDQLGGDAVLYKSIEPETLAAALASTPGTVVALQRRPGAGELARASHALGREVHDLTALNDDLESMLALLEALDEYVGVSNTNMHLRASAGRTARVLVPAPAEWRWMHSVPCSPWFPGFSIYRQSLQGDWTNALAALRSDLALNYGSVASSNIA